MAPDSSAPTPTETIRPGLVAADSRDKIRLRFRKGGSLRLLSHHDLLRTFERLLRRADIPFRRTQGFNPHPRLVFALSLPLGVIGCAEVVEIELDQPIPLDEVLTRLRAQTPPGLEILEARRIDFKVTAQVRGLCYGVTVPADRLDAVRLRIAEVLASGECWVNRTRPPLRRLDIRPFVRDLCLQGNLLRIDLALTPEGTARPEEVLGVLGLGDLTDAGAVLERLWLDLEDEPHREAVT